jgi:predicted secreted protein
MSLVGGIIVFVILWWLVLLMVLPWGVTSQLEAKDISPGTEPGAPATPALILKILATTMITTALWFFIDWIMETQFLDFNLI